MGKRNLVSLLLPILLGGCMAMALRTSSRPFPKPGPEWNTRIGQLQYRNPARAVVGDTVVSRHGAAFLLEYTTGPGLPLLRLSVEGESLRAEGLFARGPWEGKLARAPKHLSGWAKLRDAFGALEAGKSKASGPGWNATAAGRRVEMHFPSTDERYVFIFQ